MAEFRVFYSWQSDLPNATNRGFIERALQEAAKSIGGDASVEVEPVIDRDTLGIPGAPDIAHAILEKIEKSDVFVCDVSIINTDTEQRLTPNPNVLIELGYAFKSLGPSRVVLVMNTVFGKPELLPFDLRRKRVTPYVIASQDSDKSKERHRLSSELETAVRTIITEQDKARPKAIPSGDKASLKSECEEILQGGNMEQWRDLVNMLGVQSTQKLAEWIKGRSQTWDKVSHEEQEVAKFEAVEICLRSFVPIFVATEKGQPNAWRESIGVLRELALLRDSIGGGGFTDVLEIGSHMLYFAGNIGMAIAAGVKQLALVNEWLRLPMPGMRNGEPEQIPWLQVRHAHCLWGKYMPGNQSPFGDILKACESEYLRPFKFSGEISSRHFFMGSLAQSLFELARWVEDHQRLSALESRSPGDLVHDVAVWPVWVLMDPSEFRRATWSLFGSDEAIRQFVFPGNGISLEKLWGWWKKWKQVCVCALMQIKLQSRSPRMLDDKFLTLPGEPHR